MTKDVLARRLAQEANLTIRKSKVVLNSITKIVFDALNNNEEITPVQGITLSRDIYPSKQYKSFLTGEMATSNPKYRIKVKISQKARDMIEKEKVEKPVDETKIKNDVP